MNFDFIVVGHQRSGSTYFSNLLSSNPEILCFEELFNPAEVGIHDAEIEEITGYKISDVDRRDQDPELFVSTLRKATSKPLMGLKLFHDHTPAVVEELQKSDIPRIILRRNYLASYSSWLAARSSNIWHAITGDPAAKTTRAAKVGFDPSTFWDWVKTTEAFYARYRNGRYLEVDYESLGNDETLSEIATFLGAVDKFDRTAVTLSKVLESDVADRFTNLDVVVRTLRGTEWESLLPANRLPAQSKTETKIRARAEQLRSQLVRHHVSEVKGINPKGNFSGEHFIYLPDWMNGTLSNVTFFNRQGGTFDQPVSGSEMFILSESGRIAIAIGDGGSIMIVEEGVEIHGTVSFWNGGTLAVEYATSAYATHIISDHSDILINSDCLIDEQTIILGNDQHAIMRLDEGDILNGSRAEMSIGRHVWIGRRCMILPNTSIGEGTIVQAGSVASGTIGSAEVIAGNPAVTINSGVTWIRNANGVPNHREFGLLSEIRTLVETTDS